MVRAVPFIVMIAWLAACASGVGGDLSGQRVLGRRTRTGRGWRRTPTTPPSTSTPRCPFEVYSAVTAGARAGFFEAAWWRLTAPPGTVIDRLRIARYGYRFVDGADRPVGGRQPGRLDDRRLHPGRLRACGSSPGESCTVLPGAYLCDFGSKNTAAPVDFDFDATQVTYQVACLREGGTCASESGGFPLAGMTIFNAVATVRDDTPPKVSAGGALLAGGWHRPDEQVTVDASDTTGISAVAATAGAATGALATPVRLLEDGPVRERQGGKRPAHRARRRPADPDGHGQGRGRQPGRHDGHDQRRRHGAVRRVAAALPAHARGQGLRRALGRRRRADLRRRHRGADHARGREAERDAAGGAPGRGKRDRVGDRQRRQHRRRALRRGSRSATACAPATAARSRCAGACSHPRAARSRTSRCRRRRRSAATAPPRRPPARPRPTLAGASRCGWRPGRAASSGCRSRAAAGCCRSSARSPSASRLPRRSTPLGAR